MQPQKPNLVTVIIPCYQQGCFLSEAVSSLQEQTHLNWEAIIVNDGSTDETESISQSLCANDSRVRYLSKPNGGLSSARNAGLALAKGEWIQFLDADDLLLPRKFELQITLAKKNKIDILTYTDYFHGAHDYAQRRVVAARLNNKFQTSRPVLDMATRWEHDFSIPIHAALFPSSLFKKHQFHFDESLPNHEDWDMWMHLLPLVKELVFVPEELAIYRVSTNSMSRDHSQMWVGFDVAINKQRQRFVNDHEVLAGLNYLRAMNDYAHHRGVRGRIAKLIDQGLFSKWPWRVQGILKYFSAPPQKPQILRST